MKYVMAVLLVVVLAVSVSTADQNSNCKVFVTFASSPTDYAGMTNRADPASYTAFDAYFGILDYQCFTAVSFMVGVTPGMSSPGSYEALLPGGMSIGAFEAGTTVGSTECVVAGPVAVGVGHYFYLNVPGDIMILDHPDFPRWVVDCNDAVDSYCVFMNGGVCKDAELGEVGCDGISAVEASSWGGIKALYR